MSLDAFSPEKRFSVLVEDYEGDRYPITVWAIGPIGAKSTARQTALDHEIDVAAVLTVEEVVEYDEKWRAFYPDATELELRRLGGDR